MELVPHPENSFRVSTAPDDDGCVAPRLRTARYASSSRRALVARALAENPEWTVRQAKPGGGEDG